MPQIKTLLFQKCKQPMRKPDRTTMKGSKESSQYWYGKDSGGRYVIRKSDHWGPVGKTRINLLNGKGGYRPTCPCGKSYYIYA